MSHAPLGPVVASERALLLREGLWIGISNVVMALVVLAGTRFLSELVRPEVFGKYALINGALVLGSGLLFQPLGQAALRYYAEFAAIGRAGALRAMLASSYRKRVLWSAALFLGFAIVDIKWIGLFSLPLWLLLFVMLAIDAWRTVEVVMTNAARQQAAYSTLIAAESVARAAGAVFAAWLITPTVESLLLGQGLGAAGVLVVFSVCTPQPRQDSNSCSIPELQRLHQAMWGFALPLSFLPLVTWFTNLSDRYIVSGLLGLSQAGIYAAAYGIASRPFLMLGGITDATFRQPLYKALSENGHKHIRRYFIPWLAVNLSLGLLGFTVICLLRKPLTSLLLASEYADAFVLLPWIAAGYVLLIAGQSFERLAYARQRSRQATTVQAASGAVSVIAAALAATWGGVLGVAMAVPVYIGFQVSLMILVATRR